MIEVSGVTIHKDMSTGVITVEVQSGDGDRIEVSPGLLEHADAWTWDREVLTLDTVGAWRYRWTGVVQNGHLIFERIEAS